MVRWDGFILDRQIFCQWNSRRHFTKKKEYWKKLVKKHWNPEKHLLTVLTLYLSYWETKTTILENVLITLKLLIKFLKRLVQSFFYYIFKEKYWKKIVLHFYIKKEERIKNLKFETENALFEFLG